MLARILDDLVADDHWVEAKPEDMSFPNGLLLEQEAASSSKSVNLAIGRKILDLENRIGLVDGIENPDDIAKPIGRRWAAVWISCVTFNKTKSLRIQRLKKGLHPVGSKPVVVKQLPVRRSSAERFVDHEPRWFREGHETPLLRRN